MGDDLVIQVEDDRRFEILHRFLRLGNRLSAPFAAHLQDRYRISFNEFRILMLVGHFGNAASFQLVEATGLNAMSVSRALKTLVQSGRVTLLLTRATGDVRSSN